MSERIRFIRHSWGSLNALALTTLLGLTSGCNSITEVDPATSINRAVSNYSDSGDALIYLSNPVELTGSTYTQGSSSTSGFLSRTHSSHLTRDFVTSNSFLESTCEFTQTVNNNPADLNNGLYSKTTSDNCFQILKDEDPSTQLIQAINGSWKFTEGSDEFYQVNLFYHINKIKDRFLDSLSFAHKQAHFDSNRVLPPATKHNLYNTQSFWLSKNGQPSALRAYSNLKMDAKDINAYFDPANNVLGFGYTEDAFDGFKFVQDPTVIYHEYGHALVKVMMNQRNITVNEQITAVQTAHPFQSDLGASFYDEPGSINEGIADYFSYYMTNRKKVGEWAFSVLAGGHRPLTEDDSHHTADISSAAGEKLSYPQFLHYNPNYTQFNEEDVHNTGQIVTHYLVNLTETLKTSCSFESSVDTAAEIHNVSTNYVFLLLNETLAEVGDLTGKGSDYFSEDAGNYKTNSDPSTIFFTNLNSDESFLWTHFVNPPTFRKFFRIFGKNIIHHLSLDLCPGFSRDNSEQLLDEYGLLLFKSYEDKGNGYNVGSDSNEFYENFNLITHEAWVFPDLSASPDISGKILLRPVNQNTVVSEDNRRNTVLVSKDYLKVDETVSSILFDGQAEISNILTQLTFEGKNVTTTPGIAGTEYNNGKVDISPGEVVGLALNIYNNSNSTMAGVQVLANDWDHMRMKMTVPETYVVADTYVNSIVNKAGLNTAAEITGNTAIHEPCSINGFPTLSEGGVTDTSSTTKGNCSSYSKTNSQLDFENDPAFAAPLSGDKYAKYELDSPQPICLVQYSDENETRWVSQDYYRKHKLDLEDTKCLNNRTMSSDNFNPNECMIRVLPGSSTATYSKINAQSTWAETLKEDTDLNVKYNSSGIFLMEVNKWIQPGTKFNCRFRVRHSNCSDCYNSSSGAEFQDYQFTGPTPFKVIDYQFTVIQ
jgi:hypothetical protein